MSSVTSGITTTITNRFANTASQSVLWGEITGTLSNQTDLQNALNAKADTTAVPTKTSQLTNDSNFITSAEAPVQSVNTKTGTVSLTQDDIPNGTTYVQTNNNFTAEDVAKLNGIASGAQANVIETVQQNGTPLVVTDKTVNVMVPTQASDINAEPAFTKNTAFNENFETATGNIKMDGSASTGSLSTIARADHVHPTDTSRASQTDLETEVTNRTNADSALQTSIGTVTTNLNTEITNRTNADSGLQTQINTINTSMDNVAIKDGTLQTNLNADLLDGYQASAFALAAQALPLYMTYSTATSATLTEAKATPAATNYMSFAIPSTFGALGSPLAVATRTIASNITLNNSSAADLSFYCAFNGNISIEFAVRPMYSTNAGSTWTPLGARQSFGVNSFVGGTTYATLVAVPKTTINFDAITGSLSLVAGNMIKYEIYARYTNNTATCRMYCGVTLNSIDIYSSVKFYLEAVALSTTNIADNAVTNAKLGTDVKVGSLAALTTTTKTDVVSAINELKAQIAALNAKVGL